MKKFLSLVLTLALTMSLVVLPANAGGNSLTVTAEDDVTEVIEGVSVKFTAELPGISGAKYTWSYQKDGDSSFKSLSGTKSTLTWKAPSVTAAETEYTIKCVAKKDSTEYTDTCTITVINDNFAMKSEVTSTQKKLKGDATFDLTNKVYLYAKATEGSYTKNGKIAGAEYSYKSSDTDVVTVNSSSGVVSAVGNGSADVTVTAKYLGKSYTATVKFTAETLSVSAGSVANGSSFGISYNTLKSDVAKKIKSFEDLGSTPKVEKITIADAAVSHGDFYTKSTCKAADAFAGDEMPATLYFKADAGFLGTTSFTASVETKDGSYEVTVTIDVTSKGEIKDSVYATKADSDVTFKVTYEDLYVYDGSDSFKDSMYKEYSTWDHNDKNDKITVDEDDFSNGKCVLYVVALDKNDVASTGTITVYQKAYEIKYSGVAGETVTFEHDDFVSLMKEIAYDEDVITSKTSTKITLDDVDFELPSSGDGVLYYNGAKMTSSTTCKDMDKVTFAIGKNVKDTVSIDFTINATDSDKDKHEFDGTVVVSVVHEDIKYTNAAGAVVTFKASDFEDFFTDEYSKGELDYVKFDKLPTTLEGVLYASYNTLYTGALAKTSDKFYYDADSKTDYEIGDVVFKGANLTATSTKVYIPFTAYGEDKNDDDVEVSGWVVITVAPQRVMNFTDVKIGEWYYNNVKSAYNMGLIDGKTATTFNPNDNMTYAEAVKLAACMHQLKKDGAVTLTNSKTGNWYDSYVDYAIKNGIIVSAPTAAKANTAVTRREYVDVFYNALPATDYVVRNSITKIPDLANDSTNAKIYTFYKAGILTGYANTPGKTTGSFGANDNIKRSEVATILIRMMDSSTRMYFTL
ncbi:MAG: S-layer homology domain-containing protein [Eubacteriales bacterium]|nr:S-layer homology domain-containing protein [Eubacteriales bacterium]